jgi:hypothetical protein
MTTASEEDMRTAAGETLVGREVVDSLDAVRIDTHQPSSPEMESWYAPAYGCALVKQVIHYGSGTSTKVLESLKPGDPDDRLFEVPADYDEVSPSEISKRMAQRVTGDRKSCTPKADEAQNPPVLR